MNIRNFIQICIVENIKVLDLLLLFFDQLFDYLHRNKDKNCARTWPGKTEKKETGEKSIRNAWSYVTNNFGMIRVRLPYL